MKVAIFAPYALWTNHFATDLEIAQRHIDAGDEVSILTCQGQMPACDTNAPHARYACVRCSGIQNEGIKLLSQPVAVVPFAQLTETDRAEMQSLQTRFDSISELKRYRVEGFDLGMAALSSLVSLRRDPDVDLTENAQLLENLLKSAWIVYRSFLNYLRTNPTDRVYTFNARFAPLRGVLRACEQTGVDCQMHDRGCDRNHYVLFANTFPHDQDYIQANIRSAWQAAQDRPDRQAIAAGWYEDRARGVAQSWFSFITHQEPNALPSDWDPSKRNIVIFSTSEDEFVAISDDCENTVYPTQLDGLRRLITSLNERSHDLHLYLRIHPNLANAKNRQARELNALRADCLTVIGAEEKVSTYALMQAADKVVTFRSTAGIEAVYWGTPSVLAGPSFYCDLGGTYNAGSHEELLQLLEAQLTPKDREAALMYGYYYATFGIRYEHFTPQGFFNGRFRGKKLRPGFADSWQAWLLKRPRSLRNKLATLADYLSKSRGRGSLTRS